jgi:lipid-binding SYLF domain-containing protein
MLFRFRYLAVLFAAAALAGCASTGGTHHGQNQTSYPESSLARHATRVLQKQMERQSNKRIPRQLVANAKCIGVFPDVVKAGLIVGGHHGTGLVSCRQGSGGWSHAAPAVYSLSGGSIGLQAGAQKANLILLFETRDSVNALMQSHIKFGSDIAVTAGPKGFNKNTTNSNSPVVAYVTSQKGLFAGVDLGGSKLSYKQDANQKVYQQSASQPSDVLQKAHQIPASMRLFNRALQKFASGSGANAGQAQ